MPQSDGEIMGICIAPDDLTLEPDPTWVRLDDNVSRVASYTIQRGRVFELDVTDGGRASIKIADKDGSLDPTNFSSPYFGQLEPLIQAAIGRYNPVTDSWLTRFRGFVGDFDYIYDPSQRVSFLTVELVDIYEIMAQCEMQPGAFGDEPPPTASAGDVFFDNANVDDRILQLIGNAGLPIEFFRIASGNVRLYESTYSAGESILTAIQEAVDAEFPGVANFYPDRYGRGCFRGRFAKFDPEGTAEDPENWNFQEWLVGDGIYVDEDPTDRVPIREFSWNRGVSKVINSALATPVYIADADVPGQLVQDMDSIGLRGVRSWSRQNLITMERLWGVDNDALNETRLFAEYIVGNYAEPQNRIRSIVFKPVRDTDVRAAANWKFLTEVDIADAVKITVRGMGDAGFFEEPFFVEGINEEVQGRVLGSDGKIMDNVTLSLDLSSRNYFLDNPWPNPDDS